ncbi:Copper resistance protein D [Natronoarchaeum philippinense]|uniref:Copper resistance protein D n=2 Tax=Natronoarchaeum philippinense TaxID=558529 RepID=A0A285NSL4_NATPI|nr:Copper resistance protein D [Natronoarchaeum philippinense]
MTLVDAAAVTIHTIFAAVWVGSVVFMTASVIPMAKDGLLEPEAVERASGTLTTITRVSSLLLLLSGSLMASSFYTASGLFSTGRGHLVLTMVALWLVLTGLLEMTTRRLEDGLQAQRVRAPADETETWFRAASVVGFALLTIAGILSSGLI